ncbi:hotdog fold thioesterase [Arthrobacter sp. zg-Y1143]|uniref:hotdog fold thioesterase n=1 Tax=Arthrobacter sp. zg-Y1143 TaxID=3049065 RepID=UPI0024C31932|nr:hotdog fold thioesterase [Arthrobacter sp. zg-Y1143]MDK1326812.1 hotdog fold thioesterase [Arthrobacter sp. zg-Y1143]
MAGTGVTPGKSPAHPLLVFDAASQWLGIEVLELRDGAARISMLLRREMLNGFGIAHGGMVFAFADTAFALACNPEAGGPARQRTEVTVAAGADITFLASAHAGDILTAHAEHRAGSGRSGVYDIEVRADRPDGTSDVVALFRGRSRTIRGPLPDPLSRPDTGREPAPFPTGNSA